jgi:ribosomal protein S18 acetylase RimI-like enzyme
MTFREAKITDIESYMLVRMAVKENILSNPSLVTKQDNIDYITTNGKGWVCEIDNNIVGFSIVGLKQRNVWALFVHPDFEKKGIGGKLHDLMMEWYFNQTTEKIWLGTEQNSYAKIFYKKRGWEEVGLHGNDETKFEMTYDYWTNTDNLKY